ncbi:hypothetical protein LSTR_LSTR017224 [Laodelphax striatellus]|uniref:PP2A regulatory subunit B'' EF-hand domain-containing protein n=1 Tax=Laodelphax striatellus TaxID=195883 RepID=A0A482XIW8_LAOST|nr:hypothetical protein LSTR_LSTR017224 [Laodelphax striatellus]
MRKSWLEQTWIGLSLYDVTGHGYLREADLESYITFLIPTLPQLDGLENSFHNFYVCTVVRTFFFFLDPLRTGRVRIKDVVTCSFLDDLTEVSHSANLRIRILFSFILTTLGNGSTYSIQQGKK